MPAPIPAKQLDTTDGTISTVNAGDSASEGTGSGVARRDHEHAVSTAAPSTGVGGGNSEGSASSLARSDHDHTLRTTTGPTDLTIGAIADGQVLQRSGSSIIGSSAGAGDVTGPSSSTDNEIATFDSTTGKVIQANHTVTINDSSQIDEAKTISFDAEYSNGSLGATPTINWNNGQKQVGTLSANVTSITFTAPPGPCNLMLRLVQDGTGGRTVPVTAWPSTVKTGAGYTPPVASGAGDESLFSLYYNGTDYYLSWGMQDWVHPT